VSAQAPRYFQWTEDRVLAAVTFCNEIRPWAQGHRGKGAAWGKVLGLCSKHSAFVGDALLPALTEKRVGKTARLCPSTLCVVGWSSTLIVAGGVIVKVQETVQRRVEKYMSMDRHAAKESGTTEDELTPLELVLDSVGRSMEESVSIAAGDRAEKEATILKKRAEAEEGYQFTLKNAAAGRKKKARTAPIPKAVAKACCGYSRTLERDAAWVADCREQDAELELALCECGSGLLVGPAGYNTARDKALELEDDELALEQGGASACVRLPPARRRTVVVCRSSHAPNLTSGYVVWQRQHPAHEGELAAAAGRRNGGHDGRHGVQGEEQRGVVEAAG
jgi:hypothetical protein